MFDIIQEEKSNLILIELWNVKFFKLDSLFLIIVYKKFFVVFLKIIDNLHKILESKEKELLNLQKKLEEKDKLLSENEALLNEFRKLEWIMGVFFINIIFG